MPSISDTEYIYDVYLHTYTLIYEGVCVGDQLLSSTRGVLAVNDDSEVLLGMFPTEGSAREALHVAWREWLGEYTLGEDDYTSIVLKDFRKEYPWFNSGCIDVEVYLLMDTTQREEFHDYMSSIPLGPYLRKTPFWERAGTNTMESDKATK
jgi:hypothetical protein